MAAHDSGPNWHQALDAWAAPTHARAIEACPEALAATLDHATPNREAVFAQFLILHAGLIVSKVTGFAPQPQDANGNFGKVPVGSVATELDMSAPPAMAQPAAMPQPPAISQPPRAHAPQSFVAPDPYAQAAYAAPPPSMQPPIPLAFSDDQARAAVGAAAEPIIRSWLDANLHRMIEQQLASLVQQRVDQSVAATVDQRIHQTVETNLGPYIEDRVGAHVDARLAAAVEEKVTAAVKQQVANAVNQQISQAVSQQVAAAVAQQLQGQQQNVTRLVDERVKSEIRGLFQRLAGN